VACVASCSATSRQGDPDATDGQQIAPLFEQASNGTSYRIRLGRPDADALTSRHGHGGEIGGQRIGQHEQLWPIRSGGGTERGTVADSEGIGLVLGVPAHQRLDRVATPEAFGSYF